MNLRKCTNEWIEIRKWSGKRGSNSRPQPWQGCALPLSYSRSFSDTITSTREKWRPLGGSNPCYRRERAVSWTTRRRGLVYISQRLINYQQQIMMNKPPFLQIITRCK